jgi:hypothetical protein
VANGGEPFRPNDCAIEDKAGRCGDRKNKRSSCRATQIGSATANETDSLLRRQNAVRVTSRDVLRWQFLRAPSGRGF